MSSSATPTGEFLPVRVIRYGVDRPLAERRVVHAGPLPAVLEGADLRYVQVGGHEVIRRSYMAVRNRNWTRSSRASPRTRSSRTTAPSAPASRPSTSTATSTLPGTVESRG